MVLQKRVTLTSNIPFIYSSDPRTSKPSNGMVREVVYRLRWTSSTLTRYPTPLSECLSHTDDRPGWRYQPLSCPSPRHHRSCKRSLHRSARHHHKVSLQEIFLKPEEGPVRRLRQTAAREQCQTLETNHEQPSCQEERGRDIEHEKGWTGVRSCIHRDHEDTYRHREGSLDHARHWLQNWRPRWLCICACCRWWQGMVIPRFLTREVLTSSRTV
jgi:hypothetical protein